MISIVVVTYNSQLDKIIFTLQTILSQNYKEYEIIISDDGSVNSYKDEIKKFFVSEKFDRYTYVENKKNVGTVMNILGALKEVKGNYVKIFGAGDGFYNRDSLGVIINYIETTHSEVFFGLMNSYLKGSSEDYFYKPFTLPYGIIDIKKNNKDKIEKNILFYKDNISGAALVYKTDVLIKYLSDASEHIKYVEDICLLEMIVDKLELGYIDEYLYWYEGDFGISNSRKKSQIKKMRDDETKYYNYLFEKHTDNRWLNKRKRNSLFFSIPNIYIRMIVVSIMHPYRIVLFLKKYISIYVRKDYGSDNVDESFVGLIR